jgi:hypothetical protein
MSLAHAWTKRGLIYSVDSRLPWAKSHAQIPTVCSIDGTHVGVLFSSRDQANRSRIARLTFDTTQGQVLEVSASPILDLGPIGAFDDCGVMPSCVVDYADKKYLYYIGWNVRNTVPYHNSVGLAVSHDGGRSFEQLFQGPVMDRTAREPYFCATTCVRIESGVWRNWYLSCTGWHSIDGRQEPRYHLKYAESADGIEWRRHGNVAIDYNSATEGGLVRASVVKDGNTYRMWYCRRGIAGYRGEGAESYRIGYAESADGLSWRRLDEMAALPPSESGWDGSMVAYPDVFDVGAQRIMLYNGNNFGGSGFGWATTPLEATTRQIRLGQFDPIA